MDLFDLECKLETFREEQPDLFDENNKRYTGVELSNRTAELMLELINDFESALDGFHNFHPRVRKTCTARKTETGGVLGGCDGNCFECSSWHEV